MNKGFYSTLLLFSLLSSTIVFSASAETQAMNRAATAIRNYCAAKSILPFTDSARDCVEIARGNSRIYRQTIRSINSSLPQPTSARTQLQYLRDRAQAQFSIAGFDLAEQLDQASITRSIEQAIRHLDAGNLKALQTELRQAHQSLQAFEQQL